MAFEVRIEKNQKGNKETMSFTEKKAEVMSEIKLNSQNIQQQFKSKKSVDKKGPRLKPSKTNDQKSKDTEWLQCVD